MGKKYINPILALTFGMLRRNIINKTFFPKYFSHTLPNKFYLGKRYKLNEFFYQLGFEKRGRDSV